MHFFVIVLFVYNDCGFAFVGLCNHCVVLADFVVDVIL
jgi:hypothetical protein